MAYLVTGATGTLGREVVQALLNNHQTVKSASRHPESNKMIEKKTPRLVYLSSHGMENLAEVPFHARMEKRIRASGLNWHIVRPSFFMQGFGTYERDNIEQRQVIFLPAGEGKNAFVSTVDVGEAVAQLLINSQKEPQEISILTGDQAYTHFAVAEMLTDIRSEKILYANPDEKTYRRVLAEANVPKMVADYTVPLYRLIKDRKVETPTNDLRALIGRAPESLPTVLTRDFVSK